MRPLASTALAVPLLLSSFVSAVSFDCSHIQADKKKFDLSKLGGPHSVVVSDDSRPPALYNTTYTIDICKDLRKLKTIPNEDQCPGGTRVCGIVTFKNPADDTPIETAEVIPIAGNFEHEGRYLDPAYSRLKAKDSSTEGLLVELHGGLYAKKKQKAIIEFQCDKSLTGNEGHEEAGSKRRRDNKEDDDKDADPSFSSLTYVSYGTVEGKENVDVLRLNWRTKYACEDYNAGDDDDDDSNDKAKGWGFFTWFILIAFLGTATYLIFGSWLNYNRYGARGWDLLPHGDTIRDMPYLFKDWSRKVVDTVAGSGTRGGYSAV